jgi:cytoskeletal protein RodZ
VGEFGDKFRKAREKKELSLDDVSNVTKISSRMLQAIEEEHFERLPGGVFNKGFIRAYAKHLGLNDEEAVTDYLVCLRQAQIDAHEVWQPEHPGQTRPAAPEKSSLVERKQPELNKPQFNKPSFNKPSFNKPGFNKPGFNKPARKSQAPAPVEELPELQLPRAEDVRPRRRNFGEKSTLDIPWRILALTAVVVVLGIILWTRRSHNTNTAAASAPPAKTVQAASKPATVTGATTAPVPAPTRAPKNQSTPASNIGPTSSRSSTPQSSSPQATAAAPTTAPADPNNSDNDDVTVRTLPKSHPNPSEKPTASLTLVIRATETSWISVLADGQTVSQETLIAPAHTSVRASREIIAKIGNAAGVTFLWNGQEIPAAGAEAEVKTFVFDSTGMRVVPATPPPAQNQ